jgi:hypothetical protein
VDVFNVKPAGKAGVTLQEPVTDPPVFVGGMVLFTPIVNTSGALLVYGYVIFGNTGNISKEIVAVFD